MPIELKCDQAAGAQGRAAQLPEAATGNPPPAARGIRGYSHTSAAQLPEAAAYVRRPAAGGVRGCPTQMQLSCQAWLACQLELLVVIRAGGSGCTHVQHSCLVWQTWRHAELLVLAASSSTQVWHVSQREAGGRPTVTTWVWP